MTEFDGLRRELGIEGKDERKARLRRLKRDQRRALRMTRKVLKKLRDEVFHDAKVRSFDDDVIAICHRRSSRGKRQDRWVLDVAVRPLLDRDERPTCVEALDCWRDWEGNPPVGAYGGGEHPPSAVSEPDHDSLVRTLKDLLYRYPPGR